MRIVEIWARRELSPCWGGPEFSAAAEAAEAEAARHTSESVVEWLSMKFQSAIPPHETDRLCKYVLDLFPKLRVVRSIPASINIDLNAFHRTESWTNLCAMIRKRCKESNP